MWLYFDRNGTLQQRFQYYGPAFRTGATDGEIFAVFEGYETEADLANLTATLKLLKPMSGVDGSTSSYYPLEMDITTKLFDTDNFEVVPEDLTPFVNQRSYSGLVFSFNQEDDDEPAILLDTPGIWSAIISLYHPNGSISVVGRANFNVQNNGYSQNETLLSSDYTIEQIYAEIAKRIPYKSNGYIKVVNLAGPDNFVFDSAIYNVGDIIFNRNGNDLYIIDEDEKLFYISNLGRPSKEFVKNGDSNSAVVVSSENVYFTRFLRRRAKNSRVRRADRWGSKYCNTIHATPIPSGETSYDDLLGLITPSDDTHEVVWETVVASDAIDLFPNIFPQSSMNHSAKVHRMKINDSSYVYYSLPAGHKTLNINALDFKLPDTMNVIVRDNNPQTYGSGRQMIKFIDNFEVHDIYDEEQSVVGQYWTGNMARIWLEVNFTIKVIDRDFNTCELYAYVVAHRFE